MPHPGPGVQTTASVTNVSSKILNANQDRNYLLLVNKGTDIIYIKFRSAVGAGEGFPIPPGGNYEPEDWIPTEEIHAKSASGTQSLEIVEGE